MGYILIYMQELAQSLSELTTNIGRAIGQLKLDQKIGQLSRLGADMARLDFWLDQANATRLSRQHADLKKQIADWQGLEAEARDLLELAKSGDEELADELAKKFQLLKTRFEQLEFELKLAGPYDANNAFLAIHAGAGGTDAMDWAEMLMRMYSRWAEARGYQTDIIYRAGGEEAGVKSGLIKISGHLAYGRLKGEHGVHRLVRKSPFNADHLRQTSFVLVEVLPELDTSTQSEIDSKYIKVDVFRSSGHGGQSVNTTDSAVRLTHLPTGITVSVQNERSQLQNRATAMAILRSRLAKLAADQHQAELAKLKGPNIKAEWGQQIRNYVLDPYKLVKDLRTGLETSDVAAVLDGALDSFIEAYLAKNIS